MKSEMLQFLKVKKLLFLI